MFYVFFHVLFQFVDAPKAPDLQPLVDLLQALLELLAQAGLQPLRLCFVQLLQSCNLAILNQSRKGSFSSVSTPSFASKYSLESS